MKKRVFFLCTLLLLLAEVITVLAFVASDEENLQDGVEVNMVLQTVQQNWGDLNSHPADTALAYVVLDSEGAPIFRTGEGLSETVNSAIAHRDTILDVKVGEEMVGKVILYNTSAALFAARKQRAIVALVLAICLQVVLCAVYFFYLDRSVIKPFTKLKGFAQRVAGGNLDIPLTMDRQNLFGAFTESFDLMRVELKRARIAEAVANASKKELVAKLSHDIKTPVASIKAAAELGLAVEEREKTRSTYQQLLQKADQIDALVSNLFTATMEELNELTVEPADMGSDTVRGLLVNSDYQGKAVIPELPDCLLFADKLRLQQVFDNIFSNSYKYAGTAIEVSASKEEELLIVRIEDHGGGVKEEELPLLTEKFMRGSGASEKEGAGLGLYIAAYFMKGMNGELRLENGAEGLAVSVCIALSGKGQI